MRASMDQLVANHPRNLQRLQDEIASLRVEGPSDLETFADIQRDISMQFTATQVGLKQRHGLLKKLIQNMP